MDLEDGIICTGGRNMSDVEIKKEPCSSEIKPEPDSDDGLQNQIVPSSHSLMEYRNPDVTSNMKAEIKNETWWHGSISPDKFQSELSSLSQCQIRNREDVESLHESNTSTCMATIVPASYAWHPTTARIQPIQAPKYGSKDIAHAIGELRQLQESVNKHISENQFDIFGRSVASQLKNIRYYRAVLAQSQIQTLLTNIAIETLRSGES